MSARSMASLNLSFGLVNVAVSLYKAIDDNDLEFHQYEGGTSDRIRHKNVNEHTGNEVLYENIVKGHEMEDGTVVFLTADDFASAQTEASKVVNITSFVDASEIDPIMVNQSYYLGPRENGDKAFALLREAMKSLNKVGIATFIFRSRERPVAISAQGDVLILSTLFYAEEIRDPRNTLKSVPASSSVSEQELDLAKMLVNSMEGDFNLAEYRDEYKANIRELIAEKAAGHTYRKPAVTKNPAKVSDLLSALKASLER